MSKKARDFRKLSRNILTDINSHFGHHAANFITEIYKLNGKEIPEFHKLSNDELSKIYGDANSSLINKLMMNRINPIGKSYYDALQRMNQLNYLPKSTRIILESITVE